MLVAAAAAIVLANSPVADTYFAFWDSTVEVSFGGLRLAHLSELTVREWVNDGLMAVFFFVVALEIKREFTVGDLSNLRTAALPVVAAVGGMVVPAAVYFPACRAIDPGRMGHPHGDRRCVCTRVSRPRRTPGAAVGKAVPAHDGHRR